MPTTEELTGTQETPSLATQASPGTQAKGSPSIEPNVI
jgi:hypothetical protein